MLTYEQLRARLDVDEPDYLALVEVAGDAMEHLRRMAASDDVALASKAVSLAGMIGSADGVGIVADAAGSPDPILRVAAAHAAAFLPASADAALVVDRLLGDDDIGVVKVAARAAAAQGDGADRDRLERATARVAAAEQAGAKEVSRAAKETAPAAPAAAGVRRRRRAEMPPGEMVNPPRGARAGDMPTGEMG